MSNLIRLCHPVDFELLLFHKRGTTFGGLFAAFVAENLLQLIKWTNLTIQVQPRKGYTGCIRMAERNQSDIIMTLADYPAKAQNVSQGFVVTDSVMQYVSIFHATDEQLAAQMLSCFDTFSLDLWFLIILTVGAIYFLKKYKAHLFKYSLRRKRNRYYLYKIVTHLTRLGRVNSKGLLNKVLFLDLSFASLILVYYFLTMIKTDLVVVKQPDIYKSYDDLIAKNVLLSFYKGVGQENYFKMAPDGSKEKILWNLTMSRTSEDKIMFGLDSSLDILTSNIVNFLNRKEVIALDNILSPIFQVLACKLKSDDDQANRLFDLFKVNYTITGSDLYVGQDENALRSQRTFLYSKYFTGSNYEVINGRLKHSFEMGLILHAIIQAGHLDASEVTGVVTPKDPQKLEALRLCLEGVQIQSKKQLDALMLQNMLSLTWATVILLIISSVILLSELLDSQLKVISRPVVL